MSKCKEKQTTTQNRFSFINDDGHELVFYKEDEFREAIEKARREEIIRCTDPPTTHGSSSFNKRWTACGNQAAREQGTLTAIKRLEANGLSVPKKYEQALIPSIDCYSG